MEALEAGGLQEKPRPVWRGVSSSRFVACFFVFLLAAAPPLFALATWDTTGTGTPFQGMVRFLYLPIVAIEIAVIFYASRQGLRISPLLHALPAWVKMALGLLMSIAVGTALLVAPDRMIACIRTGIWIIHLLFGFALAYLFTDRWSALRALLWPAVVIGCCAYLALLALVALSVPAPEDFDWVALGLGVGHVRQTGFYAIVGTGAALGWAAVEKRAVPYWCAVCAATLLSAMSFWTGTRSSIVAVAAAFAAGAIFLPALRSAKSFLALVISFAGGAVLSLPWPVPDQQYGIFRISRSIAANSVEELGSTRLSTWLGTIREIFDRPLFGHGESQFRNLVPEAMGKYTHPHNAVLQITFNWGIIGSACFFALGAMLLWRSVRRAQSGTDECPAALLVILGLLVMSLYEGSLHHPYPVMMVVLGFTFLLTAPARQRRQAGVNVAEASSRM
mgnify:CR=1 FL=1